MIEYGLFLSMISRSWGCGGRSWEFEHDWEFGHGWVFGVRWERMLM